MLHALRRQPARWMWPGLVALSFAFVFSRGLQFQGNWLWTADWTAGVLFLTGPITAAAAAWQARFVHVHMPQAATLAPRMRAMRLVLGGHLALALTAELAVLITAAVLTWIKNPHPDSVLHFVVVLPILAGYVALGALVGTAWTAMAAAPVVGVGCYVVASSSVGLLPRALTRFGGGTADPTGLAPRLSFELGYTGFGLGLCGTALVAGTWVITKRSPNITRLTVGVASVALAAASFAFFETTDLDRFRPRTAQKACASKQELTLCVANTERYKLGSVLDDLAEILTVERATGASGLPSTFNAISDSNLSGYAPNAPERPLELGDLASARGRVERLSVLLRTALVDVRCIDKMIDTDLDRATTDLTIAGNLIIYRMTSDQNLEALPGMSVLRTRTQGDQNRWLAAVLSAADGCRLSSMPPPLA